MSEATANGKDLEGRINRLEADIVAMNQRMQNDWALFQNLFGVRLVPQPNGTIALMIVNPKKDQGRPGMLAEMFFKLNKLWSQYGESGVVLPDLQNPLGTGQNG